MPEASIAQVIDNIVDNAIYWLRQKAEKNERLLRIELDSTNSSLTISNNGPAIQPNVKKNLFAMPFTTSKPEGRGLGMYLISQILQQHGGHVKLVDAAAGDRVLPGAAFRITFGRNGSL